MVKIKSLNVVVTFVGTPYIINDMGVSKSPRFELYDTVTRNIISKSNNPLDFDGIVFGGDLDVFDEQVASDKKRKRRTKSTAISKE